MNTTLTTLATVTAVIVAITWSSRVHAIEEPDYTVISSNEMFELREYAPYLVAETDVSGTQREAGNRAFRILAGYIFGDNQQNEKMAMTAPVISQPDSSDALTESADEDKRWRYQFVMESKYDAESLPQPVDGRVEIKEIPSRLVAAHRFSGRWSEKRVKEKEVLLLASLEARGISVISSPILARYNGPFTPWFMRRNEILVVVEETQRGEE